MDWLKPLNGGTWLNEPARESVRSRIGPTVRTVAGEQTTLEERVAKAKDLANVYRRGKVARLMGVDASTVTKWLGAIYTEKRPYAKRPHEDSRRKESRPSGCSQEMAPVRKGQGLFTAPQGKERWSKSGAGK
jgi:hypothetical protein